jgi:transcription antitermination factor NusG
MEGVLRFLGQRDDGYRLMGDDKKFAEILHSHNGTIGIMKTYREGDRVKLARDMMGGFEGEIIKLDRRKGRALIEYNFDGNCYKVWVGYEMIEDDEKPVLD